MEFQLAADGLAFPEGPAAMADGSVLVVEIRSGRLVRVSPDGAKTVVAELGGGPNGAAVGPDGALYVCNNGGLEFADVAPDLAVPGHAPADYVSGSIQRVDLTDGSVSTLYDACDGRPLRGPNDIVFDRHGGFWFTDLGKHDEWSRDQGWLFYAGVDGKSLRRVRGGMFGPNGVGLSPDGTVLYVAETYTGRLWAMEVTGPGELAPSPLPWAPGRLVVTLPGHQMIDSLAVEAGGKVCVAGGPDGGITVIDPDGAHEHVRIPGEVIVTNICFGGPDLRTAWITASGSGRLYRAAWPRPGLELAFS
ncbi:SMP-30/gluconolactonase/LRE family protein [Phenylobacterium sp.]|uniref:SMP-30/gluconolactonase/LRE family protein n=1 Tax=Phenylobacterium sp. TaxID=1871053 RepID=UPI0035B41670